jgi:hypothetical protein
MGKCLWCEKELPATDADTCGSCLFRSRDELGSSREGDDDPGNVKINHDLSGLGEDDSKAKKGKMAGELQRDLFMNSAKEQNSFPNQEILMKTVKVHSNSMRNKLFVVGDGLVLDFDENGDAFVAESDVPVIKAYSRMRPGRLSVVEEAKPEPKPAPAPKKVVKKEEAKAEKKAEDSESKTEAKPRAAKKKAPKKSFFKKDEE